MTRAYAAHFEEMCEHELFCDDLDMPARGCQSPAVLRLWGVGERATPLCVEHLPDRWRERFYRGISGMDFNW